MIVVVNARNRRLFKADVVDMHRQRKTVFVDGAGWKLPVIGNLEVDQYDRTDTIYLFAKDWTGGAVLASVRLLTTTGPHLMCDLFQAKDRAVIPRGPTIWEVSRFCTAPGIHSRNRRLALLWEIIGGVVETALLYGIEQVIFAANRALLPLARDAGWAATTLAPRYRDGEDEISAVVAETTQESLRSVRRRHRIPIPVIQFYTNATALPRFDPLESSPTTAEARIRPTHSAWRKWRLEHPSFPGAPRHG